MDYSPYADQDTEERAAERSLYVHVSRPEDMVPGNFNYHEWAWLGLHHVSPPLFLSFFFLLFSIFF